MYNGIGLQTPRGSGTNGYIQRNLGFARPIKKKDLRFDPAEDEKRRAKVAMARQQPDAELIEHNRRRAIEVALEEWAESVNLYDDDTLTEEEIESRKAAKRIEIEEQMRAKAAEPPSKRQVSSSSKAKMFGQYAEA